ncbi:TetR/AcrR family transcriptional regulator [Frondihabitans cladoniiphilus]|uniref:HTH tetR-type domain-containing protein n=1 Tax=Frondihabitans cladoniiphilus TaxID=715785 RepID=A0ABP8VPN9_9MICO
MTVESPRSAVQRSLGLDRDKLPGLGADEQAALHQPGPGAKQRVLVTADRLFYDEGIRTVGVDRLISESSVTKATFYKHFGSKDNLVLDYINRRHEAAVAIVDEIRAGAEGSAIGVLRGIVSAITAGMQASAFRGCPFINAAAEFSEAAHPVRLVVVAHRDWYTEMLVDLFKGAGHPLPGDAADEFALARDGALVGGYAGDAIAAAAALARVSDRLFADCAAN